MMKDMYTAFTKELLENCATCRYFWIYYRYDDMPECKPLVANPKSGFNTDPQKRIQDASGMPVRLYFEELRFWFRLLDKFIRNDPGLKIMIVDCEEISDRKTVMAVGKAGKWNVRAQYEPALRKVLVGGLPNNTSLAYAC